MPSSESNSLFNRALALAILRGLILATAVVAAFSWLVPPSGVRLGFFLNLGLIAWSIVVVALLARSAIGCLWRRSKLRAAPLPFTNDDLEDPPLARSSRNNKDDDDYFFFSRPNIDRIRDSE